MDKEIDFQTDKSTTENKINSMDKEIDFQTDNCDTHN